jgi:hypothetical protein
MTDVDVGGGDRLALAVLVKYRMATTEQMHLVIAPGVPIEQTRRRLAKLRTEGLVDRITLPRAGRTRVWFPTQYGVQVATEWPELRGRRSSKTVADPTAVRLRVGHGLTVTETALAFLQDARHQHMSDPPPAERLANLRTLEVWLGWQLRDTQRKIEQVEQQTRATGGYITEQERRAGQAVGVTIHAADCPKIHQPVATLTATDAQYALVKDASFTHPCQHCRPDKTLGILKD